jgi:hypothetical protein
LYLGRVLIKSKEKHLKHREKISNLENASFNLIHVPLTICKRFLKRILQRICKNKTRGANEFQNFKLEENHPCTSIEISLLVSIPSNLWFNSILLYLLWFVLASITKKEEIEREIGSNLFDKNFGG